MRLPSNPIFDKPVRAVAPDDIQAPTVFREEKTTDRRELVRLFRRETADQFIGQLRQGIHVFGVTKGQFSLVDVLRVLSNQAGPVDLALSTWTVADADLGELQELCDAQRFTSVRFLIDFSFQRRQPALIGHIRRTFGSEAVVVTRNHAKFMLLGNASWKLVVRTSMNLNFNPRLEDIEVKDDPELYRFLDDILNDLFRRHETAAQATKTVRELSAEFNRLAL